MSYETRTSNTLHRPKRRAVSVQMLDKFGAILVEGESFDVTHGDKDPEILNRRLVTELENLRKDVSKLKISVKDDGPLIDIEPLPDSLCHKALNALMKIGRETYNRLPEGARRVLTNLEENEGTDNISLDMMFPPGQSFLWEMIYSGSMFQPLKKDDFWGFRFPIGQVYSKAKMVTELRLADGVFASAYSALPHAAEELDLIRHKLVAIKQRLNRDIAFTSLDELAQEIFGDEADSDQRGQRLLMHFLELHFRYGLVHFACHCENPPLPGAVNTAPVASLARLVLMTAKPEKEARLCLNVLDSMAAEKMQFQHRPLVFLNACESDTSLASLQSLNFPKTFIDFGAGGVVATHCTMPDNFAAAFSAHFYNQLLGKPMDEESYIGEALLETRRYFLYERNIPLGLAYGQYTMSDQYLEIE